MADAVPAAPTLINPVAGICYHSSATFVIQNPVAGIRYNWYSASTGGTLLTTGSSFTTSFLNTNTVFYVEAADVSGAVSTRVSATANVVPPPSAPTVSVTPANATISGGQTALLSVSAVVPGLTYNWYASATSVVPIATGVSYTTPLLFSTTTYYVEAVNAPGCVSPKAPVLITVDTNYNLNCDVPNSQANSTNGLCIGCSVTNAGGAVDTDTTTASTLNMTVALLGALVQQTLIFPSVGEPGDTVFILMKVPSSVLAASTLSAIQISSSNGVTDNNDKTTLSLVVSNLVVSASGNTLYVKFVPLPAFDRIQITVNSGIVPALTSLNIYYAVKQVAPPMVSQYDLSGCAGSAVTLNASTPDNVSVQWFNTGEGGTVLPNGTGNTYITPPLTGNAVYYAQASRTSNGCANTARTLVYVNQVASPVITQQPQASTVLNNGNTSLFTGAAGGGAITYQWQVDEGGGFVDIANGGIYTNANTATLNINGALMTMNGYHYRCVVSGCVPTVTSNAVVLTVMQSAQTLTFSTQTNGGAVSATYGDAPINGTATSSAGLTPVYTSSHPAVAAVDATGQVTIAGAGTTVITVSQSGDNAHAAAMDISFTLTVAPKALTIKANNQTKTYDGTAFSGGSGVAYTGFALNENETVLSGGLTYGGNSQGAVNAGTYTIVPSGLTSSNYTITFQPGTLLITANNTNTLSFNTQTTGGTITTSYGGSDINGSAVASSGLAATYSSGNTGVATINSNGQIHIAGTGSTVITASQAGNSNYGPAPDISFTLQVNPVPLTITARNQSKTYDGIAYSGGNGVIYNGFAGGENESVLSGTLSYGGTAQGMVDAGNYSIVPSGLTSSNYTITWVPGTLSIVAQGNNVITFNSQTAGAVVNVTYGQGMLDGSAIASSALPVTYTSSNAAVAAVATGGQITIKGAGTAVITATQDGNANHTAATPVSFTIQVARQPLTITANNQNKIYDGVAYGGGNGVVYTGFVNGEDAVSLGGGLVYTGTSQGVVNTGSYFITPSGLSSSNYSISYKDGSLTITKATLLTTANAQTKVYGDTDPVFTYQVTGWAAADNTRLTTGSLSRVVGEHAGTYSIDQHTLSAGNNYNIVYTTNTLTITKAVLQVSVADAAICLNARLPAFPVRYSGFKRGDVSSSLSTAPVVVIQTPTTAGSYTLTPSGGVSVDYTFDYVPGTLVVTPVPTGSIVQSATAPGSTAGYQLTAPEGASYRWNTGEISNSITVRTSGTYDVTVVNQQGCTALFNTDISMGATISIPNTFSPNGDGINDYWSIPELKNHPGASVVILNQNGQKVFESKNFIRWDGRYSGNDLPAGVYFYLIDLRTGVSGRYKGWINLVR